MLARKINREVDELFMFRKHFSALGDKTNQLVIARDATWNSTFNTLFRASIDTALSNGQNDILLWFTSLWYNYKS